VTIKISRDLPRLKVAILMINFPELLSKKKFTRKCLNQFKLEAGIGLEIILESLRKLPHLIYSIVKKCKKRLESPCSKTKMRWFYQMIKSKKKYPLLKLDKCSQLNNLQ
jgi:hypothetical protein